jgi:hypothetical protein
VSKSFWISVAFLLALPFLAAAQSRLLAKIEDPQPAAVESRIIELEGRVHQLEAIVARLEQSR